MENFSCCYFMILWTGKKPIFVFAYTSTSVYLLLLHLSYVSVSVCVLNWQHLLSTMLPMITHDARASYLLFLFACPQLIFCDSFSYYSFVVNCQPIVCLFYLSIIFICQSIILLSIFSAKLNDQVRVITSSFSIYGYLNLSYPFFYFFYVYVLSIRLIFLDQRLRLFFSLFYFGFCLYLFIPSCSLYSFSLSLIFPLGISWFFISSFLLQMRMERSFFSYKKEVRFTNLSFLYFNFLRNLDTLANSSASLSF